MHMAAANSWDTLTFRKPFAKIYLAETFVYIYTEILQFKKIFSNPRHQVGDGHELQTYLSTDECSPHKEKGSARVSAAPREVRPSAAFRKGPWLSSGARSLAKARPLRHTLLPEACFLSAVYLTDFKGLL